MNLFIRSSLALALSSSLVISLTGCSAPSFTGAEALQSLADAGMPCDFPVNIAVTGGSGFSCMDELNGAVGYTLQFFDTNDDLSVALTGACDAPVGPGVKQKGLNTFVLRGENWFATSDEGSKYSVADLKAVLGGSEAKLADICK